MKSFIVAISGASGSIYGIKLVKELIRTEAAVHLCISDQAVSIIRAETGIDLSGINLLETEDKIRKHFKSETIRYYSNGNLAAPISSGSYKTDGMFVVPCSMKTLAGIANGYASNLIERAADVVMKEGRSLIISPREMPFNTIHLENMLKLSKMGVTIAPPIPAFYQRPENVEHIIEFVTGKLLDSAGIENSLFKRWDGVMNQD
ncbi:MAG: UbiX family flavin prenyltransferase [Nitrospiraceae bacterium]|nr:MAG: UbiX family flavin prenyltransferase [Nitrospiraceae bacterium]